MEIDLRKTFWGLDYKKYAEKVISFPDFLIENNYKLTTAECNNFLNDYSLKSEIKELFSKYIQRCHLDLQLDYDLIDEYQEDMYFFLLHLSNFVLGFKKTNNNEKTNIEEWFTGIFINVCMFENKGQVHVELSNEKGKIIPNYGYLIFLDFKNYLKERISLKEGDNFPENDFSENEDKEKLINLEKLKILDFVKSIQTNPDKISHTAEILSSVTGIKSSTLYSYLRPMLSANRDDADKNSPYKNKENVLKSNKTIQKLKIKNLDAND